jgi:hypothetical protein
VPGVNGYPFPECRKNAEEKFKNISVYQKKFAFFR